MTDNEKTTVHSEHHDTPSSETDTEVKQTESVSESSSVDGDVDEDDVNVLPGTGGPDDVGDVNVDPKDLNV